MTKYKIGEIAELLGLTTEGLRFYEKNNLVVPEKDKFSGTRYYGVWDIHLLIRAKTYRRLGFSVKDIHQIIHTSRQDEQRIHQILDQKTEDIEQKIIEQINFLKRVREIKQLYSQASLMINNYKLELSPAIFRINTQNNYDLIADQATRALARQWIELSPFVFSSGLFRRAALEQQGSEYHMGLGINAEYAHYLNITASELIHYYPARLSLFTVLPSDTNTILSPVLLADALHYLRENGLQLSDDAFSIAINFHKDSTRYGNYHLVWLPIDPLSLS